MCITMRLTATQSTALWKRLASLSFLFALCFSMAAQNGCEDDAGNVYGPYEVLVVSDDPCENFTCAQTAFGFTWVINAEYLDDCSGEDDEDGNDGVEDIDLEEWAIYLDSLCSDDQLDGSHYVYCCLLERLNACAEGDESACEELIEWIETGEGPCAEDDEEDGEDDGEEEEDGDGEEDGDDEEEEDDDEEDGDDDDDEDGNDGVEDLDLEEWAIYLDSLCSYDQLDGSHYVYCCLLESLNACAEGDESACEELIEWIETGEGPCAEDDGDDEDDDEEGEGGGEEECLVQFEFEQATDEAGLPLPYNVIAYVDEPDADTYYFWTFGDGMESDEPNPTHVYEEVGNYEVCLTVTQVMGNQFTCTAVYCDTLMIDTDGLVRQQLTLNVLFPGQTLNSVAEQEATLSVFPNPAADAFRIQASAGIESAVVRTMDGRWVGCWVAGGIQSMEISSAGWPTGAYVIEARTARGVVRSRLLVQR